MVARQPPESFLVAFSLAGEQRELVRAVAVEVEQLLGEPNVFFDEWWEHLIAGGDADLKLQDIYEKAVVVVVCVSEQYGSKPWTRAEHAAIRARLMMAQGSGSEADKLGVLPVRVGDGEVEGILFNTIVPDIRARTAQEAARLVVDRLGLLGGGHQRDPSIAPGARTHRVERGDTLDGLAARYLGDPTEWRRVASVNGILDPLDLCPGQLVLIPESVDDGHGART